MRVPAIPLSGDNLGQVVHTREPPSPSSIIWYRGQGAVMPGGWKSNRTSGVALAMRHKLQWFIHLRVHGLRKGDEHPAYTPRGARGNNTHHCILVGRVSKAAELMCILRQTLTRCVLHATAYNLLSSACCYKASFLSRVALRRQSERCEDLFCWSLHHAFETTSRRHPIPPRLTARQISNDQSLFCSP